jgi:hypothetical protein
MSRLLRTLDQNAPVVTIYIRIGREKKRVIYPRIRYILLYIFPVLEQSSSPLSANATPPPLRVSPRRMRNL